VGSQSRRLTGSQAHRVAGSQGRRLTGSQAHRVAGSQGRRLTGSQGHRITGPQGHMHCMHDGTHAGAWGICRGMLG
jgi:hypothetical protein